MTLDHAPKQKFETEKQTPLLTEFVKKFRSEFSDKFQKYIDRSLITRRFPNGRLSEAVELLEADSIREQLITLKTETERNPTLNGNGEPITFDELLSSGYVVKVDGVKTQAVSKYGGDEAGDAYVAANFEIMLMVANELNCDIAVGIYSGDENVGLILPRANHKAPTQEEIEYTFDQMNDLYYSHNLNQAKFFEAIKAQVKANEKQDLGTTFKIKKIADSKIHKAPRDFTYRDRTLLAGFIDNAEDKASYPDSIPLLGAIRHTLLKDRGVVKPDHARFAPEDVASWPAEYRELHEELAEAFGKDTPDYYKALSYLELSIYEPIYGGDLKVRKFQNLKTDAQEAINKRGETVQMIRFADTQLKDTNETSHLLGDYHMVATVREVQNYLMRHKIFKDKAELHSYLKFYQHHGSFMMSIETGVDRPDLANEIVALLDDPLALNTDILTNAVTYNKIPTTSSHLHAMPYIVATTHYEDQKNDGKLTPIILHNDQDIAEFFNANQETLDQIKATQIRKETDAIIQASLSLTLIPEQIIAMIDLITSKLIVNQDTKHLVKYLADPDQVLLQINWLSEFLPNLAPAYFTRRPARVELLNSHRELQSALARIP